MIVLNRQVNPVYSLESQIIEVSECILLISYGNLKVGGGPTVNLGLKMLSENNPPMLVAWTVWFYASIKWEYGHSSETHAVFVGLKWWWLAFGLKERAGFVVQKEQSSIYHKGSKTRQETESVFNEKTKKNKAKLFKFFNHSWEFGGLFTRKS